MYYKFDKFNNIWQLKLKKKKKWNVYRMKTPILIKHFGWYISLKMLNLNLFKL